jgi:hypothetical protein
MNVVIERGPDTGRQLPFGRAPLIIGRDPACDLVLTDPSVSARHLQVRVMPSGAIEVTDLHSTNGTWIAGQMISGPVQVGPGQQVVVGASAFHVEATGPQERQSVTPDPLRARHDVVPTPPAGLIHAGPMAGGDVNMTGDNVAGRDLVVHEGIRFRTRMTEKARRLLFFGLALFFIGLAVGFGALAVFNNEIFNEEPSFDGPSQEIKTAFAVAFVGGGLNLLGIIFIIVALVMRRERVQEITAGRVR